MKASDLNPHHSRIHRMRFLVVRAGRILAGNSDHAAALRTLAVLSRDGELPGFELVTRGAR